MIVFLNLIKIKLLIYIIEQINWKNLLEKLFLNEFFQHEL
jgi:hypothetical protein